MLRYDINTDNSSNNSDTAESSLKSDKSHNAQNKPNTQTTTLKQAKMRLKQANQGQVREFVARTTLVPFREKRIAFAKRTEPGRPFPTRTLFSKVRGSAHSEKAFCSTLNPMRDCVWPIVHITAHHLEEQQDLPIQNMSQFTDEFQLSQKLIEALKSIPETHEEFQSTLRKVNKLQIRIVTYVQNSAASLPQFEQF